MEPYLTFSEALEAMKKGARVTAEFLPATIFITIQKPDGNSMNTEPYLKMVQVEEAETENTCTIKIVKCEPWEAGRRSLFSDKWILSKYNGKTI